MEEEDERDTKSTIIVLFVIAVLLTHSVTFFIGRGLRNAGGLSSYIALIIGSEKK